MSRSERDVWKEIDDLRRELALLKAKKEILQQHSMALKDVADEMDKNANLVRQIADKVRDVLSDDID